MTSFDVMGRLGLDHSGFQSGGQAVLGQIDKMSSAFDALGGVAAGAGVVVGGAIAGVSVAAFNFSNDVSKSQDQIAGAFGVAREEAVGLTQEMQEVWEAGFGENVEDATAAVIEVRNQMKLLAEDEISNATTAALKLGEQWEDADLVRSTNAANSLMKEFGLTSDEAFDFIAAGYQKGLNSSGDFLDSISEYGVLFDEAGFTADEMFSIMETGLQSGALGTDKYSDGIKEFGIRIQELSDDMMDTLKFDLRLDTTEFYEGITSGNLSVADAYKMVMDGLQGMEDPIAQNSAGVKLFGAAWEDMGAEAFLATDAAATSLDELSGSMSALDVKYQSFGAVGEQIKRQLIMSLQPLGDEMLAAVNASMPQVQEGFAWFSEQLPIWIADGQNAVSGFILEITSFAGIDTSQFTSGWDAIPVLFTEIKTVIVDNKDSIIGAMQGIGAAFAIAGTVTAVGAAIATLTNPITLLIGASVALGVAWTQDWGGIQGKTEEAWNIIKPIFDTADMALTVTLPQAMVVLRAGWDQDWGGVRTTIEDGWDAVKSAFDAADTALTVTLPQAMAVLRIGWDQNWGGVRTTIEAGGETIIGIFNSLYEFTTVTLPEGITIFSTQWAAAWENALSYVNALWDKVTAFVDWLYSLSVPNPFDWGGGATEPDATGGEPRTTSPEGFAKGTSYAPGGFAFIAEAGPELLVSPKGQQQIVSQPSFGYLERGSQVKTAAETSRMLAPSSTFNFSAPITVNSAKGRELIAARSVSNEMRQILQRARARGVR